MVTPAPPPVYAVRMAETHDQALPPEIDITRAHTARMYDYYLGGKNHFAADREVAEQVLSTMPQARTVARENRACHAARRPGPGQLPGRLARHR